MVCELSSLATVWGTASLESLYLKPKSRAHNFDVPYIIYSIFSKSQACNLQSFQSAELGRWLVGPLEGSTEVNAPPMHRVAYIKMVILVYAPPLYRLLEVRREETCFLSLVLLRRRYAGSMVN